MEESGPAPFRHFEDFWPFYVSQHRRHGTRAMHFAGTTLGFVFLALTLATGQPQFLLSGLICGYGLSWIGHFFIEKNRPATFRHPVWSFLGDMKMYALMWRGGMTAEAERLGYPRPEPAGTAAGHPVS